MFAFNDSAAAAAAAAITIGEAADAPAGADVAVAVLNNLTRTAQLEDGVQQLLDRWRFQVCASASMLMNRGGAATQEHENVIL